MARSHKGKLATDFTDCADFVLASFDVPSKAGFRSVRSVQGPDFQHSEMVGVAHPTFFWENFEIAGLTGKRILVIVWS